MKISITDISWGIDRATGEHREKTDGEFVFEAVLGDLPAVGGAGKVFTITALTENSVTVLLNTSGQKATIICGACYTYRPVSFDGGHYYRLRLEKNKGE